MRKSIAITSTILLLALTGCAGGSEPAPTVTVTETATTEPSPTQEPVEETEPASEPTDEQTEDSGERYVSHGTSPRGNLIKHVGDWAGIGTAESDEVMSVDFRIAEIEFGIECTTSFAGKSENGQFVGLVIEVESYPELEEVGTFSISEHDFKAFDKDGKRINDPQGQGYTCLTDGERLPSEIGPAEKVTGKVVLDLPENAAVVVFSSWLTEGAWEWPLHLNDDV